MKWLPVLVNILFIFIQFNYVNACTAFCLAKKNKYVLVGKNLDWPIGDGFILINPRGIPKTALIVSDGKPAQWISKYGSVTFNQFGKGFPLGGMNEVGLVIEELSYSPSVFPQKDNVGAVNELQWIQYQLDNFGTVSELLNNLGNLNISKLMFGLHYFISDRLGNSAVIEFIDGKTLLYAGAKLPVPALTNNSYANAIKYLKLHKGFGGKMGIRSGPESPDRFVRAAKLLQNNDASLPTSPVLFAFSILKNVEQEDTKWSIVYDALYLKIYFKTDDNSSTHLIELKNFNFQASQYLYYPVESKGMNSDRGEIKFSPLTQSQNNNLLNTIFEKLIRFEEFPSEEATKLKNKLELWYVEPSK